jgi:DNA-directed RNA polymerase subunit RPC12/RpoP
MSKQPAQFDLYTFVAGAALETGKPFQLVCNCGGVVTIMPPFEDEYVVCPRCESRIKMLVMEDDPGYIIGKDTDGTLKLLPVQGSSIPHPDELSPAERENVLAKIRTQLKMEDN